MKKEKLKKMMTVMYTQLTAPEERDKAKREAEKKKRIEDKKSDVGF